MSYINDYSLLCPQVLYLILDCITLITAVSQNKEYNKNKNTKENENENSKINSNFFINSEKEISDLNLTTHCFIDKTGTITQNEQF